MKAERKERKFVQIKLYNEDCEEFLELKKKLNFKKNVNLVKKLMGFYKVNSPYWKQYGESRGKGRRIKDGAI